MPYKHRQDVLEQANNAPPHVHVSHLTVHDLHDKPAAHEKEHLLSAIGVVTAGEPFSVHYPGPTVVYIIEGELVAEDESKPGETINARAGDVVHVEGDTRLTCKKAVKDAKVLGVTYFSTRIQSMNDFIIKN